MDLQKYQKAIIICSHFHKKKKNHIVGSTLLCARYVMILDGLIIIIKWNVSMELGANNYNSKTFNSSTKS